MEYYPIHPGNYGITVDSIKTATTTKNVRRKRKREDDSGDVGRNSEHDRSTSTSSAAVNTPATTRRIIGESREVNQIGEATDTSSLPNVAVNPSSTTAPTSSSTAPTSSATDSADAKRLEQLAERKQRQEEKWKRNRRESIARVIGHDVDSDGEREYWRSCSARDRAEEARREALSPEVSSAHPHVIRMIARVW
jgi:hypothetical protein